MLESIGISYKTLMYLSENLCYHFGQTLRNKKIAVNFYAAPSAQQCFREMDENRRGYISLRCLKKKLAETGKFKDVDKDKFGSFFEYLDEFKRVHYSQFLVSTKSRAYRELLHIRNPMIDRSSKCSTSTLYFALELSLSFMMSCFSFWALVNISSLSLKIASFSLSALYNFSSASFSKAVCLFLSFTAANNTAWCSDSYHSK